MSVAVASTLNLFQQSPMQNQKGDARATICEKRMAGKNAYKEGLYWGKTKKLIVFTSLPLIPAPLFGCCDLHLR
jgi:hypothetical protein